MQDGFKQRPVVLSVLTGVTALVGGIEPAAADVILSQQGFGTINVNATNGGRFSGNFSGAGSDPTSFGLFDTQGGARELTGVSITVTSTSSQVEASISGSCASGTSGDNCGGNATNSSEFSVAISLGGASFTPSTQLLSTTASDICSIIGPPLPRACFYSETADTLTLPGAFTFSATTLQLSQFIGVGMFSVTPTINLSGAFSFVSQGLVFENSFSASAHTDWSGTIDVSYDYRLVNAVPEPATLFLAGLGVAGLGLARRKTQCK